MEAPTLCLSIFLDYMKEFFFFIFIIINTLLYEQIIANEFGD